MAPDVLAPGRNQVAQDWLRPDWAVPAAVTSLMSTRHGGISPTPFDSLNLRPPELQGQGMDEPAHVRENQRRFAAQLGAVPVWLDQVHGADVVLLRAGDADLGRPLPRADASVSTVPGLACAVLVADCLPVLMCSDNGLAVGAAHAGWRGLAGGVLENTLALLCREAGCAPAQVQAWMGACIGPSEFEVGSDVLQAFGVEPLAQDQGHFAFRPRPDASPRWLADLQALARQRLRQAGLSRVGGGHWCTVQAASRFFSFRREGRTGRMAAAIALRA